MKQFGRKWQLSIGIGTETLTTNQLRVAFDIDKTIQAQPNAAKIQIWNLNRNHINQLLQQGKGYSVSLAAGYDTPHLIFKGDVTRTTVTRQGMDFIVSMECGDGRNAYTQSRSAISLKAGATDQDIVDKLHQSLGLPVEKIDIPNARALPRGKVMTGDTRTLLNIAARNNDANWFIQDGRFVFLPKDKTLDNEVVLISQETGMIFAPELTNDGVELRTLLNPLLKVGAKIELKSILSYFDGLYKIVRLKHQGDCFGNDWTSHLTVVKL